MANLASASAHLKAFVLGAILAVLGLGGYTWWGQTSVAAELPAVTVYKSPTCGCCTKWVDHLQQNGFEVQVQDRADMQAVKEELGIPQRLSSCHTAAVDGYVVEGHVPADDIRRLLHERPQAAGLAVPGMPVGSPGMEQGTRRDPYDVLLFTEDGGVGVYARYGE